MLAILLSLLFGLVAFAALAELYASIRRGVAESRHVLAELRRDEIARQVSRRRAVRAAAPLRLAAA